jgi:hypothetical protein
VNGNFSAVFHSDIGKKAFVAFQKSCRLQGGIEFHSWARNEWGFFKNVIFIVFEE